jgi:protein SCO1
VRALPLVGWTFSGRVIDNGMITCSARQREQPFSLRYLLCMRWVLWFVAALAVFGCSGPTFNGVLLEPSDRAPALQLTDSVGRRYDLAADRGRVVLVFFGYTHCPDVCPTTLLDWRHAADSLGSAASSSVRFIFVSVDPERDSPALTQRYAARFDPTFLGLSGSQAEIDALLKHWKLAAFRDGTPGDTSSTYTVSHPSQVMVVDREGNLRLLQRAGLTPAQIAHDIRELL